MKDKLMEEIRDILVQIKTWLYLETRYFKLTAAEKISIIIGSLVLGAICFLLVLIAVVILSFCLVDVFAPLVGSTLAYLIVSGIFIVIAGIILLLRKPLIMNPMAKMISKLLLEHKDNN